MTHYDMPFPTMSQAITNGFKTGLNLLFFMEAKRGLN